MSRSHPYQPDGQSTSTAPFSGAPSLGTEWRRPSREVKPSGLPRISPGSFIGSFGPVPGSSAQERAVETTAEVFPAVRPSAAWWCQTPTNRVLPARSSRNYCIENKRWSRAIGSNRGKSEFRTRACGRETRIRDQTSVIATIWPTLRPLRPPASCGHELEKSPWTAVPEIQSPLVGRSRRPTDRSQSDHRVASRRWQRGHPRKCTQRPGNPTATKRLLPRQSARW